jgi:hypothetical protein
MRAFVLLALSSAGCLTSSADPPTPPTATRAVPLHRAAPAALDGRETFALSGRGDTRFVTVIETPHLTAAVQDDGTLVDLAGPVGAAPAALARDVLPELRASADGRVVAFAVRSADAVADVHILSDGRLQRLTEGLPAIVLAVSPHGDEVAFLAASGGVPALWAVPVAGGAPQQLTNVGVTRDAARPGRAPEGFVPPPQRAADVSWVDGVIAYAVSGGRFRIDARSGEVLERP